MQNKQKNSLKHFVRNILIRRLVLVTVLLCILVGTVTYFKNSHNINERVTGIAQDRFETLRARTAEFMQEPNISLQQAVDKALTALSSIKFDNSAGNFVYFKILTTNGVNLAEKLDDDFNHIETVKRYLKQSSLSQEDINIKQQAFINLEDNLYVHLVTPIFNPEGKLTGNLTAMFALSESIVSEFRNRVALSVFYAILILLSTIALLYPVVMSLTKKLASSAVDLLDSNMETLQMLGSAIALRDSDTNAHNYRVAILAVRLGEQMNLAEKQIEQLIKGAFLHDVGKIGITDNILLKPGKLSDDEFTVMKTHVNLGLDIVKRSAWLADALDVVGSHHEKYDGSGYPEGLSGDDIPIYARIFAIADVFDALASERPYKKAFTFEKTMEILEESSGSHFDPELIDNFKIIAKALHDELKNLDDESLRLKLDDITHQYYSAGLESLMY